VAKSIEEYTAEVSKSYDNSRNALQNQINAIEGNLATTQKQINENYANQQNLLNNQRNQAASAASMQAAGSGGSFGGRANIANKKYYEQTFVPAQTQLNTNQSQALENAQSQANSNRLTLESQLASLNDEIARQGLARYYDELEKERQAELQRKAIAAQAASYANYLGQGGGSSANWGRGAEYGYSDAEGFYFHDANGNPITAATYAAQTGENLNGILQRMANSGDANARRALAGMNNANHELTGEERVAFNTLGISTNGYRSRA
jgi:hypothetical protein